MRMKRKQPLSLDLPEEDPAADVVEESPKEKPSRASVRPPPAEHVEAMERLKARQSRQQPGKSSAPLRGVAVEPSGWVRMAYPVAGAAALAWAGGLVAFVLGFQSHFGAFDYGALQWVVIGALAALPALFILLAAAAMRQGARLAAETRRARILAEDLAIPAALAADQTGGAMDAMRAEIEKAVAAAQDAQVPIALLSEALSEESRRFTRTAAEARETGRQIAESLGRERAALTQLAEALKAQSAEAIEALTVQSRVVADSSDLAQAQLHEAQAALAARAADLAVAAGDASAAALLAGDKLASEVERMESAGDNVGDRLHKLQLGLSREREDLVSVAEGLRLDHEDLSAQMETRRAQLHAAAEDARTAAVVINEATETGAEALRSLVSSAATEVLRLAETAQREQEEMDIRAREALGRLAGALAEERDSLEQQTRAAIEQLAAAAEEARRSAAGHVESAALAASEHAKAAKHNIDSLAQSAGAKIDQLGEAAFAAGRKADEMFEARLAAAHRLIEQSSSLVEESGRMSAERIESGLNATRTAVEDIQGLMAQVDARFDQLPDAVRERATAIHAAVDQGVRDLTAAARAAAEETQAIDAAFQERVRRNYEVLSEAVRLMGRVAGAVAAEPGAAPPIQQPIRRPPEPQREAAEERPPVEARTAVAVGDRNLHVPMNEGATARGGDPLRPAALSDPAAVRETRPVETAGPSASAAAGLRPRLRLTPAAIDEPAGAMFEPRAPEPRPAPSVEPKPEPKPAAAAPEPEPEAPLHAGPEARPAKEANGWTWKDLLSTMDDPVDDEALAERLMGEIAALGVDAHALLPRSRVDEIAAVLQAGDAGGAREVVRRLAPAAVRRLSRRVLTDRVLRAEADAYVRRYETLLSESATRDREGYMTAALLGSEPGRAFLLLDAAIGDLS